MAKVIEDTGYTNLTGNVNTIRDEQTKGGNTKAKVSNVIQSIINYLHERNIEGGGGGISDLTGYSWWGRSFPTEGTDEQKKTLKGSLSGDIDFIQFSNGVRVGVDSASNTLKVYKDGSTANFYATGGVSALGMSSSGGGGGGGTDLGTFLSKLNSDNPSLSQGYLYYSGGNNGTFYMTAGGGGSGLTPGNLAKALDGEPVPTRAGYLYFNGSDYSWGNPGGSSYVLPTASNDVLGGVKVGSGLTITDGKLSVTTSGITSVNVGGTGNAVTSAQVSGNTLYLTKGFTYLSSIPMATDNSYGGFKTGSNTGLILNTATGILSLTTSGVTSGTYTKVTVDQYGRVTSGANPTTLAGYGITDAVNKNTTWWGRPIGSDNTVTGDMTYVGSITMSKYIYMDNNNGIGIKDTYSNHDYLTVLGFNTVNTFFIGYGTRKYGYQTDIQGGTITFATNNDVKGDDSRLEVAEFTPTGQLHLKQYDSLTKGLKIGNVVLYYNSGNKALCIQNDDGTPANFYATGGVSALGMSAGTSSIDSMTFNYLTVSNRLNMGSSGRTSSIVDSDGRLVLSGNEGVKIDSPTVIDEDLNVTGHLTAPSFYFDVDDTTKQYYLFMRGSTLKFYANGTEKTVSLV